MVILVDGTALRESPRNITWFYSQFPTLREGAKGIKGEDTRQLTGRGTLYVSVREFAVIQSQDTKIEVVGTDTLINNTAVIIRNTGEKTEQTLSSTTLLLSTGTQVRKQNRHFHQQRCCYHQEHR